jgi:hypothetical protein
MSNQYNISPGDNHIKSEDRLIPDVFREITVTLTDDDPGHEDLPEDVKSVTLLSDVDCKAWVSYYNGNDDLDYLDDGTPIVATQVNAAADGRVVTLKEGQPFTIAQQKEFNRVHGIVADGSGTKTILCYPGRGKVPELNS